MNINELEQLTGITRQNIRFYEKKGLLHPARNSDNNYRTYTQDDLTQLKIIKFLRKLDFSLEEIRQLLQNETSLNQALEHHLRKLLDRQRELNACIDVCKSLLHKTKSHAAGSAMQPAVQQPTADVISPFFQLEALDIDKMLQEMDTMEKNGGKFMSIMQDYKRFAIIEELKHFSFKPDTMIQNPEEFRDALLQYAGENHLDLVITKGGMYPTFTIDGREYTAYRAHGRFGATVHCDLTHPEKLDIEDISKPRKRIYHFIHGPYLFLLLFFITMAVSRHSIKWTLLVAVTLFCYLYWIFVQSR